MSKAVSKPRKVFNKDGSYRWQINYRDPDGRQVKKRFKKLDEAAAVLETARVSKRNKTYDKIFTKEEAPYLFHDLARDYLAAYQGQRAFDDKQQVVQGILLPAFADAALDGLTYRTLELFRSQRLQTPTWQGKSRSPARVNRELSILRHMLNKAVQWGKLDGSPFSKGESLFLKENNERIRYLTRDEAGRLLEACSKHLRLIVETALNTGMRKGEILSLKWSQVRDGWIYLEETKSGKGRPVPINDAQQEVFWELRTDHQLRSPFIFTDNQGKHYKNVQRSFDSACKKAGIYDFRFHDLRHTAASWLVMAGVDLVAVQKLLGHSSIKTTMRYAHLAPGHMQKAVNQIGTREVGNGNSGRISQDFKVL